VEIDLTGESRGALMIDWYEKRKEIMPNIKANVVIVSSVDK